MGKAVEKSHEASSLILYWILNEGRISVTDSFYVCKLSVSSRESNTGYLARYGINKRGYGVFAF